MKVTLKKQDHQFYIFMIGIIIFGIIASFGWVKLQYGFNFIDEGYHATESWRLTAGDHFLKDKITGALMHYTLINRLFFEVCPDITLLGLRRIQFVLTISSLFFLGLALFKASGRYAELPFIFSVFAFTGLDPIGMVSNLYYQTYPHLFLTLHLSFLLFGLSAQSPSAKKILFILSGVSLWGLSLSHLTLSVIILSPLLLYWVQKKFNFRYYNFTFKELIYLLLPFILLWSVFIIIFNKAYVINIFSSIEVILSMPSHSTGLIGINWELIKYVSISALILTAFFLILRLRHIIFILSAGALLSLVTFFIIKTSFFGVLAPYYNGFFGRPMWFSSLLIAFALFFWAYNFFKYFTQKMPDNKDQELSIVLVVPFTICCLTMSIFSGLGSLAVCQTAIPAVAGIFFFVATRLNGHESQKHSEMKISPIPPLQRGAGGIFTAKHLKYPPMMALVMVLLLMGPFYYMTAENDWEFTFFDVPPARADTIIENGFGKGIYTNRLYAKLYDWLIVNAETFTQPNDYAISYAVAPMVHMITKLRPALDDTFITFTKSRSYFEGCIDFMEQKDREPKIAFIFERMPALYPSSRGKGTVGFLGKSFDFMTSMDPISVYIRKHMTPAATFKISDDHIIRCYVDFNLGKDPQIQIP